MMVSAAPGTAPVPPIQSSASSGIWPRAGFIVLAGLLTFSNNLSGPFVFDDYHAIVANAEIRDWHHLRGFLRAPLESPVAGRPLVDFSFAINYAIAGLEVRPYHAVNIGIHLFCALLIFAVMQRMLALPRICSGIGRHSADIAFATAIIWVVHPLNSEVVDYTTQRTESMMALFYLLTLYGSLRALEARRATAWNGLAVIACGLGMACKESMVTAPITVMLIDALIVFPSPKEAIRARWRLYVTLAATWVVLIALIWRGPRSRSAGFATSVGVWTYLLNQTIMIVRYLRLAFWPTGLVLHYGTPAALTLSDVWPHATLVVLLLAVTIVLLVRKSTLSIPAAWFFITLAATSSIVPIATEVGAERRMYLPLIALVALTVIGCSSVFRMLESSVAPVSVVSRNWFAIQAVALFAVCAGLSTATMARNREYVSALELAQTVLDRWPSGVAHAMVGSELASLKDDVAAIPHLREAVLTYPRARYNLGVELFNAGQVDEALIQLHMFAQQYPWPPDVVHARKALGKIYASRRNWLQAVEQYRLILSAVPTDLETRRLLADALMQRQAFAEAAREYQAYLAQRPDDTAARENLRFVLGQISSSR